MRVNRLLILSVFLLLPFHASAQQPATSPTVQKYVRVNAPRVVLEHVRVIDGSGQPSVEDQNIIIEHGKIASVTAGEDAPAVAGTAILILRGYSVIPGIV